MQSVSAMYPPSTIQAQQLQLLQWINSIYPYQHPFGVPLLQNPLTQSAFQPTKEEDFLPNNNNPFNFASQVQQSFQQQLQQHSMQIINSSPLSGCFQDNLAAESTQENSPKPAIYHIGLGMNDCFTLQEKSLEKAKLGFPLEQIMNNSAFVSKQQILSKPECVPICKKIKKTQPQKELMSSTKNRKDSCSLSAQMHLQSNSINPRGFGDDKNIIHINFTKNLLKSYRRYCEQNFKNNTVLLQQIKRDFETNHMNNQLLMHFMTSPETKESFQFFVDGPAQKWVKEQSRLKKQDQQLELIEICRSRVFDKIKVKKYSPDAPFQTEEEAQVPSAAGSQNVPSTLIAHPIFSQIETHGTHIKSTLTTSSSSKEDNLPVSKHNTISNKPNNQSSKKQSQKLKVNPEADYSNSVSQGSSSSSSSSKLSSNPASLKVFEAKIEDVELIKIEDEC